MGPIAEHPTTPPRLAMDRGQNPAPRRRAGTRAVLVGLLFALSLTTWALPTRASRPDLFDPEFELVFEHFTVDNGLPENSVRSILQDSDGFLWFGTQNGLVRYDGLEMRVYSPSSNSRYGFEGRTVMSMLEDREERLWIGTLLRGLWSYDRQQGSFEPFDLGSALPEGSSIFDIAEDAHGRLWLATSRGLLEVDPVSGETLAHPIAASFAGMEAEPTIQSVLVDERQRILCGTESHGLIIYQAGASPRLYGHEDNASDSLPGNTVFDIYQDDEGRIWLAGEGGLSLWQETSESFRNLTPELPAGTGEAWVFTSIVGDGQGDLWLGTGSGMAIFDPARSRFRHFTHDRRREGSLSNGPVLSLFVDRSGLIWAGSWHTGLNKADPDGGLFQFRRFTMPGGDSRSAWVEAVLEDRDGGLWLGLSDSPRVRGMGALLYREVDGAEFVSIPVDSEDGEIRSVLSLAEDDDGRIWVGSFEGLWTVERGRLVRAQMGSSPEALVLQDGLVRSISTADPERLWMVTWDGLFCWDEGRGELTRYHHDPADPSSITTNELISLHVDAMGRVWVGTDLHGLILYQPTEDRFQNFFDPDLGLETIIDIHESEDGILWFGTFSGLVRFDPATGHSILYDRAAGLPNDQITSVLEDTDGRLWLSTGYGVAMFDPVAESSLNFDVRDGLPDNEIKFANHKGRDGVLYLGGQDTLTRFEPWRFETSSYLPPIALTGISISDTILGGASGLFPTGSRPNHETLRLRHDENNLSFRFAVLDFARPERNQYRYRLEGYDKAWRIPGAGRQASYTNLPPGDFRFRVIGSNRDGRWNEEGIELPIHILRPWWTTRTAKTIYVLLLLLLAFFVYRQLTQRARMRVKLRMQRARAEHLQELDELKSRFLTNITHEFRTPLTLIKAQLARLGSTGDEEELGRHRIDSAIRNADRLEELIGQLLDLSRLEAGRLPLRWQFGDYLGFLRLFASAFDSLAAQRSIGLELRFPEGSASAWFDADLVEKIVGNLLSNAVKFTPEGGRITIAVQEGRELQHARVPGVGRPTRNLAIGGARELIIKVTNTGTYLSDEERARVFDRFYRASTAGGSGVGLALVKELTEWIGGSIGVTSSHGEGTCFTVTLPIFQSDPEGQAASGVPSAAASTAEDPMVESEETTTEIEEAVPELPTVLVVEDHEELRTFMHEDLVENYRVLQAVDGQVGLEMAIEEIPDLVLSDVMMPGMDGFELCHRLKEDERTSHIPVILLTALSETESKHQGLRLGADDYLAKPFHIAELRLRISNLIEQRRRLAARYEKQLAKLSPEMMPVSSSNDRFVVQVRTIIDDNLDDAEFNIEQLCRDAGMSRSQLHRKLRAITGMTTSEFVRTHRLQRALHLLEGGYGNVTEVAYAVGFQSLSYFSRSFRQLYGDQPSEHLKSPPVDPTRDQIKGQLEDESAAD